MPGAVSLRPAVARRQSRVLREQVLAHGADAGIAFDGISVWVVCHGDNKLLKVDPATGSVVTTYLTGKGPFAIALGGGKAWVPNFSSDSVSMTAAN